MEEEDILGHILQHWREWCKSRGKGLRSLREPLKAWNSITKRETFLRKSEREARRALRAQRQRYILEECLVDTANRKLSDATQVARLLKDSNSNRVPFADQVDKLLEKYERQHDSYGDAHQSKNDTQPEQLEPLKRLHSLICQPANDKQVSTDTAPLLDLIVLAGFVQHTLNERAFRVDERLTEKHYISTGVEDDPLFFSLGEDSSVTPYSPSVLHKEDVTAAANDDFLTSLDSTIFDVDKENMKSYMDELTVIQKKSLSESNSPSLIDTLAFAAKDNLKKMKHDVRLSQIDVRGSQIHLLNYNEFIEKKKKQRIQCIRDLREHCCTCRGPHIAKPPFSHGKDYRREPTHEQCQKEKCSFICKKKRELDWLDETIGKYGTNQERFEREIAMCVDEKERRKDGLKDALANSLRLMEMAN